MIQHERYENAMYKSWSEKGGGTKLKSFCLQTDTKSNLKKVTLNFITQIFSFDSSQHQRGLHGHDDSTLFTVSLMLLL